MAPFKKLTVFFKIPLIYFIVWIFRESITNPNDLTIRDVFHHAIHLCSYDWSSLECGQKVRKFQKSKFRCTKYILSLFSEVSARDVNFNKKKSSLFFPSSVLILNNSIIYFILKAFMVCDFDAPTNSALLGVLLGIRLISIFQYPRGLQIVLFLLHVDPSDIDQD